MATKSRPGDGGGAGRGVRGGGGYGVIFDEAAPTASKKSLLTRLRDLATAQPKRTR
ncbi:hypothetical protein [Pseudonocardia sp. ICBG162]|uniref:hypothetical protein n=1 Tax=Pseudonocardia sp. ICBG162 TaxID=2846761 RepID=UPI001CF6D63E|nr:hypothetical protein [Pseudonocardia sp. ICBG162]